VGHAGSQVDDKRINKILCEKEKKLNDTEHF
jgi:hypothetical protein